MAVETGDAIVSFGSGPQVGEAVAGDVVNTASRMQSLAPRDSLVVGERTLRALRGAFDVEALPPAKVKGKTEPLLAWRVLAEREEPPDRARVVFVGREGELHLLEDLFERAVAVPTVETVTVLGDAGLGKSRLLAELADALEGRARRLTGACAPYGEGGVLAPVAETVRSLAGIEPADDARDTMRKLADLAERAAPIDERLWLASRLGAVVAPEAQAGGPAISTAEMADAWARVLAAASAERALLLVIEDLHWGDHALVEVVSGVAERLEGSPAMLAVTARPDLLERHAGWGASAVDATTIALRPLAEDETVALLGSAIVHARGAAPVRDEVLRRAGGNPLYVIEFARMLAETEHLGGEIATPDSVQAVIGARLDMIPDDLRSLMQDAAVVGEEFWAEVLVNPDRSEADARTGVAELVRRELVEPVPSPLAGVPAFGFAHALIREVAYARLPRSARASRHLHVATWLEGAAGDRVAEWAESLARHYGAAAELATTAGAPDIAEAARDRAVRWLMTAGERAMRIDPGGAFAAFERALALTPEGTAERVGVLSRSAMAGRRAGLLDAGEVLRRYETALEQARAIGDDLLTGELLTRVGSQLGALGEGGRAADALDEAIRVLEPRGPSHALAGAYAYRAEEEMFAGRAPEAMELADRALATVDADDEYAVMALHIRGDARCASGDVGGLDDLRSALRRALEAGDAGEVVTSRAYLGDWRFAMEGPAAGLEELEPGITSAIQHGMHARALYAKGSAISALYESGDWDRALVWCEEILQIPEERRDPPVTIRALATRSRIELARGTEVPVELADRLLATAGESRELQSLTPAIAAAAAIRVSHGDRDGALELLRQFEEATRGVAPEYRFAELASVVRTALEAGDVEVAASLTEIDPPDMLRYRLQAAAARAEVAAARVEPDAAIACAEVAEMWRSYGAPYEEAMALLARARLDTAAEGAEERAGGLLRSLGIGST